MSNLSLIPVRLADRAVINQYLNPYSIGNHEYCFTNLYIWREFCDIRYAIFDNALLIYKYDYNRQYRFFMQPIGYQTNQLPDLLEKLQSWCIKHGEPLVFGHTENRFVQALRQLETNPFSVLEQVDDADYIYRVENLISLKGNKYAAKRQHLNHFLKNADYTLLSLDESHLNTCCRFLEEWVGDAATPDTLQHEISVIESLLKNKKWLGLEALGVIIGGKMNALIIGEQLSEDTVVFHIEKAKKDIKGLYVFLKKTFLEKYYPSATYLNFEQDLGLANLRKAKQQLHPERLEPKYMIRFNNADLSK